MQHFRVEDENFQTCSVLQSCREEQKSQLLRKPQKSLLRLETDSQHSVVRLSLCSAISLLQEDRGISRRRVVQNLESSRRSMMKRKTETLDAAFKKRFFALSSDAAAGHESGGFSQRDNARRLTLRKGTIRALEQRRNSHFGSTIDKRHVIFCFSWVQRTNLGQSLRVGCRGGRDRN